MRRRRLGRVGADLAPRRGRRLDGVGQELAGAVRGSRATRPPFRRRAVQVRFYDARGQAQRLDPGGEPGRRLVAAAEELVRVSGRRAGETP